MRFTFRSQAHESTQYRPDIDGLRAIAVLSVVLYHARVRGFSGGFVGVDIFFVISGYLITSVIQRDIDLDRFSFWSFYERRMRRIFPALFAVALFCVVIGAGLFPPLQFKDFGKSLLAMTGFVSNFYFQRISLGTGYFEPASGTQYLLHTWSLSVEEQFYVLFPIALLLLAGVVKTQKKIILFSCALLSFVLSIVIVNKFRIAAFYLLPGRAWELLIGALLALKAVPPLRSPVTRSLAGIAGLAGIAYGVICLSDGLPFPGYNVLFPCLGSWLVLYAGEGGFSPIKSLLGFRPLVFIGAISYSLYLWHWPMLALAKYYYAVPFLNSDRSLYPVLASLIFAILSFEFIETPFRTRRHNRAESHAAVWRGLGVSAAFAVLALAIIFFHGIPQRYHANKRRLLDANYSKKAEFANIGDCANWHTDPKQYSDVTFCEVGHTSRNILFWGDSHISQLYPLLKDMQQTNQFPGKGLVFAVAGACPPAENYNLTSPGYHCDKFASYAMERAAKSDIDTIFVQFSPWWALINGSVCAAKDGDCTEPLTGAEAEHRVVQEMSEHILNWKAAGKRVIIGLPYPVYSELIPDFEIRRIAMGRYTLGAPWPFDLTKIIHWQELRDVATRDGAEIYAPRDTLCPNDGCIYEVDGVSLYSDQSHFAISQLWILHDGLLRSLSPQTVAVTPQAESNGATAPKIPGPSRREVGAQAHGTHPETRPAPARPSATNP